MKTILEKMNNNGKENNKTLKMSIKPPNGVLIRRLKIVLKKKKREMIMRKRNLTGRTDRD